MVRSSRKEKRNHPKSKVRSSKSSKFSVHNNDFLQGLKNPPNGGGSPSSYLYGNQTGDKAKRGKRTDTRKKKKSFVAHKGNKKSRRVFISRFPVIGTKTPTAPWLKGKQSPGDGPKASKTSRKQQNRKIMNGAFSVNEPGMEFLRFELEEFWRYVTLTHKEIRAREYLIQQIKKSCRNLFGIDDSQCQVFGSFSAQPICIFESDIDLAIWGVVEPDSDEEPVKEEPVVNKDDPVIDDNQNETKRKKQNRILQWKALIDDAASNVRQGDSSEESTPVEQIKAEKIGSEITGSPLFVLDRHGDGDCNERNETDDGSECESDSISDSESVSVNDDIADKLENFWSRQHVDNDRNGVEVTTQNPVPISVPNGRVQHYDDDGDDDDSDSDSSVNLGGTISNDVVNTRRPRGQSLVSLSSSTTCSVEAKLDESEMEVSYVVEASKPPIKEKLGPSGRTRTRVVNSLYKLTKPLRSFASHMHVRKKARVPIINMVTHFGFECDIALGGHNGTDTSSYASTQLSRFKSFSTLVVFLKVLLSQQGLDKPFTGGLGSYSIYVMVANHIERHLEMGGDDDPAEVLYTFFFRYGSVQHSNPKITSTCRTNLSQELVIQTQDGGAADMKSCFQIENCVTTFEKCWRMLHKRLSSCSNRNFSILQYMVDAIKLEMGRSQSKKQAEMNLRKVTSQSEITNFRPFREEKKDTFADEARELIAGYGQKVDTFLPGKEICSYERKNKQKKKKRQKTS